MNAGGILTGGKVIPNVLMVFGATVGAWAMLRLVGAERERLMGASPSPGTAESLQTPTSTPAAMPK